MGGRRVLPLTSQLVEFRRLGRSGLNISEIAYGNWLTHGSQVEEDAAHACVRAALDAGITTFDTADVYAGTKAESVLGRALVTERFPNNDQKMSSLVWYGISRSTMIRRWRFPKARVGLGADI